MDKELIKQVAISIYGEFDDTNYQSAFKSMCAKNVITLVTQANKSAVIDAVDKVEGEFYVATPDSISRGETIAAITTALDTEVK